LGLAERLPRRSLPVQVILPAPLAEIGQKPLTTFGFTASWFAFIAL
jgi:hypothetical protein